MSAACLCVNVLRVVFSVAAAVLCLVDAVEFVAGAHLPGNLERHTVTLAYGLHCLQVHARVFERYVNSTGGGSRYEYLVTGLYFACFNQEFTNTQF